MRDDKICHTTHSYEVEAEVKKAQDESEGVDADQLPASSEGPNEVDPASTSLPSTDATKRPSQPTSSRPPKPISTATTRTPKPIPGPSSTPLTKSKPRPKPIAQPQVIDLTEDDDSITTPITPITPVTEWECPTCTLLNPLATRSCEACTTPNPAPTSIKSDNHIGGWYCDFCGSGPRDMGFWSCSECGWVRKWG